MSPSRITGSIASLALVLVPLAVVAEKAVPEVWSNRLYNPLYREEPNRHTPAHVIGTYLPPLFKTDVTYTQADSPLFLTSSTTVPTNVTVTLREGVTVFAHEFATLRVDGTLIATGTVDTPVTFTTNEVHPDNQNWNGVVVGNDGKATLTHTLIEYASPALTCERGSAVSANVLHTDHGLVGLYTESPTCSVINSRLQALQYGIVARGVDAVITQTNISAGKKDVYVRSF